MIFRILNDKESKFVGDKSSAYQNLISTITARKMLRKGCHGYLALVRDASAKKTSISDVPVAYEILDVFPDELPGLQPHREIEFCIDVVPDTAPIFMPPYRMAPTELKELKEQLQELLDNGFIRPNTSPWGALVLFVKKMMVHFDCALIIKSSTR